MRNLFAFIVLLVWLLFGSWFYTCKVKKLCSDVQLNLSSQKVEVINPEDLKKAYSSVFEAEKDLIVLKNEPSIGINDEFVSSVDQIAYFLKNHPQTKVAITGMYQPDEVNPTGFKNLGFARAEMVKRNLLQKGVEEKQIVLLSEAKDNMFDENGEAKDIELIDFKFSEAYAELNDSDIKSAYKSTFTLQDLIYFQRDSSFVDLAEQFEDASKDIAFFLNKNKDQNLKLELAFENDERAGLKDMDIGLVRSFNLKQKMVRKGFEKERMIITSNQGYDIFKEDGFNKPESININFIFPDKSDEEKLAEMQVERELEKQLTLALRSQKEDSLKNSLSNIDESVLEEKALLNFEFASSEILNDETALDAALSELKRYMQANPQKQVEIIGHTCSMGDNYYNYLLGQKRAEAAKSLLANYGINVAKVTIKSKGEESPIHDNNTKQGRELNRRVEIDII